MDGTMLIVDSRKTAPGYVEPEAPEVWGKVEGFTPATNRILIKRLPPPPDGLIARPEIAQELAERGHVIAQGLNLSGHAVPPIGSLVTFSKYGAEEKRFDDEGTDKYVLVWLHDVRGWHHA